MQRQEVSTERGARTGSALGEVRGTGRRGGGRRVSSATLGSVGFVLRWTLKGHGKTMLMRMSLSGSLR